MEKIRKGIRKEKFLNDTIWAVVNVRKNILEVIEEKLLSYFVHLNRMTGNRLSRRFLEWEPEVTQRKGRPKERWMERVRQSMTELGLIVENDRNRDMWRNLVLGEGRPLFIGQIL